MDEKTEAVKEVAATAGKAIDATREFGGFISKYIAGSLEQGFGIFEDKLKYMRWERQQRLMMKAEEFAKQIGLMQPNKAIKMKYAIPLFQSASLEEEDYLQDLWAKLLVNSSNIESKIELNRTYIDILERLSVLEVQILNTIYSYDYEELLTKSILTIGLPEQLLFREEDDKNEYKLEDNNVNLALLNLERLGCIEIGRSFWTTRRINSSIHPTLLGKNFILACNMT
jgi:hypothetical protein